MRSYDFGNKLEEQQFEKLACEVVGQREGIRLQTYRKGKDQGKDGFWYDEKDNIVLQAKCYQDFQNLFKKLKGEVKKVEKLQPKRYILVVSLPLSAGEAEKIRELFGGWIRKSEDLIDGNMLNSLLSDPDYRWIEKNFTGLWMPDGAVLEELLADALQKGRRMRNAREWRKAVEACRSFVQTNVYEEAAKRLEQDHVVVLSGQPGMGKTTIARILALGFLKPDPEEKAADGEWTKWQRDGFCWVFGLDELEEVWEEDTKQVFVLDDYWGAVLHRERSRRESMRLSDLIYQIEGAENKRLIITSREYIVQQAMDQNPELSDLIRGRKLECVVKGYTNAEKARILFAHLQAADLEWDYVQSIFWCCDWLVNHAGYSPRVIEQFFKECHPADYQPMEYAKELKAWIEYPERMWEGVFRELSEEARVTALIAAISHTPALLSDIRETYGSYVRRYAGEEAPKAFEACVSELEETVVFTYFDEESDEISLDFENPSVLDFLLDYLSMNREYYVPRLAACSIYYDQLLMLLEHFKGMDCRVDEQMEKRCVEEFYTLPMRQQGYEGPGFWESPWDGGGYWSRRAFHLMRTSAKRPGSRVWKFIKEYVENFFDRLEMGRRGEEDGEVIIDGPNEMEDFVGLLIECEKCGMHFNGEIMLQKYWEHCILFPEYCGFWELEKAYPEVFHSIEKGRRQYMKRYLKQILLDTLAEYRYREFWVAQDVLVDSIPYILKDYGLYYTRKFKEQIEEITGRYYEEPLIKIKGDYEELRRLSPEESEYFRAKAEGRERLLGLFDQEIWSDVEIELKRYRFTEEDEGLLHAAIEEGRPWYVREFLQDPGGFEILKRIEEEEKDCFQRIFESLDEFMATVWLEMWETLPGLIGAAAAVCVDYAAEVMWMSNPVLSFKKMKDMVSYRKLTGENERAEEILFRYLFRRQGTWVWPRQDSVILYWLCRQVKYEGEFDWECFLESGWTPLIRTADGEKEKYLPVFARPVNEDWIRLICLIMNEIDHEDFQQHYVLPKLCDFLREMEAKEEGRAYGLLEALRWELRVNSRKDLCGASFFMMRPMTLAEIFEIADFGELETLIPDETLQKLQQCRDICREEEKDIWIEVYKAEREVLEQTGVLELLEDYLAKIDRYVRGERSFA